MFSILYFLGDYNVINCLSLIFLIISFPFNLVMILNQVLDLKRFSGMRYRTKLETLVDFPFELNLLNYAANSSRKKKLAHVFSHTFFSTTDQNKLSMVLIVMSKESKDIYLTNGSIFYLKF